jgi:hypothetical protein
LNPRQSWLRLRLLKNPWVLRAIEQADAHFIPFTQATPQGLSRSSTPGLQTEAASAENIEADNQLLKQLSAAIIDITALEAQVLTIWNEELCMMLPESAEESDGLGVPANAEGESHLGY